MANDVNSAAGVDPGASTALIDTLDGLTPRMRDLELSANSFARAMTTAFASSVSGGKGFDDVLKSLALRLSDLTLRAAFRPVANGIAGGLQSLFSGIAGSGSTANAGVAAAMGAVKPFAAGGVLGTPTYFPLASGGVGLAGESGPEAIMPLARGADGRLGIASPGGGTSSSITVNITSPDLDSFRRSESYLTGQIARAVARGQRSL
jgi:phage-related minor tail protein